ncbi:MAG TPA: DNA polymerase III subunit delta [Myxococcales bacterium]|jgi:DNA polymerase-3 subunit delta
MSTANDALLKEIEAGKAPPVYLITGEEFLVRKASDEIVGKLLPKAMAGLNLAIHEGSSPADVARDLATMPMFRGRKVVVVREPEFLAPKKGRADALGKIKEAWSAGRRKVAANRALALFGRAGWGPDQLLAPDTGAISRELEIELADSDVAFLKEIGTFCKAENLTAPEGDTGALERLLEKGAPKDHHLVIEAVHLDSRSTLAKLCIKVGTLVDRKVERELRKLDIHETVVDSLASFKKKLEPAAEKLLKDLCGGNMRLLQSELEKLALYVGEAGTIREADVEAIVRRAREDEFRELSDALGSRDLKATLRYVGTALDQGEAALKIHGAIASIVRRMLEDRVRWSALGFSARTGKGDFDRRGIPELEKEAQERGSKVPHPYVAWLGFQSCMRFEPRELVDVMLAVAQADVSLKSGGTGKLVLESLALKVCQRRA